MANNPTKEACEDDVSKDEVLKDLLNRREWP